MPSCPDYFQVLVMSIASYIRYNILEPSETAAFTLGISTRSTKGVQLSVCGKVKPLVLHSQLTPCTQYIGEKEVEGMVVMEVEMVSGWEVESLEELVTTITSVQRAERWLPSLSLSQGQG